MKLKDNIQVSVAPPLCKAAVTCLRNTVEPFSLLIFKHCSKAVANVQQIKA